MDYYPGCRLHQIGPYIGKIRPSLARQLVLDHSSGGDWVWDPFCGSGTVPLECRLLGRNVVASDVNPYACALTRAKLHAPRSLDNCLAQLNKAALSRESHSGTGDIAPKWVLDFFHEQTLREIKSIASHFIRRRQYFHMGCLLSILHHQRPGFLSYPASHLVPYLRNKRFPRERYPEAYEYRDPIPRLESKIIRTLSFPPPPPITRFTVLQRSVIHRYLPSESIDTIITSPPYMNALDYARDNRLRLWLLGVEDFRTVKQREIGKINTFGSDMAITLRIMTDVLKPGGTCILVLGDVRHSSRSYNVPSMILDLVNIYAPALVLENQWSDTIPDRHRSRRNGRATRQESVMIFRRV